MSLLTQMQRLESEVTPLVKAEQGQVVLTKGEFASYQAICVSFKESVDSLAADFNKFLTPERLARIGELHQTLGIIEGFRCYTERSNRMKDVYGDNLGKLDPEIPFTEYNKPVQLLLSFAKHLY